MNGVSPYCYEKTYFKKSRKKINRRHRNTHETREVFDSQMNEGKIISILQLTLSPQIPRLDRLGNGCVGKRIFSPIRTVCGRVVLHGSCFPAVLRVFPPNRHLANHEPYGPRRGERTCRGSSGTSQGHLGRAARVGAVWVGSWGPGIEGGIDMAFAMASPIGFLSVVLDAC